MKGTMKAAVLYQEFQVSLDELSHLCFWVFSCFLQDALKQVVHHPSITVSSKSLGEGIYQLWGLHFLQKVIPPAAGWTTVENFQ